jgi:hypothetical protein
MTSFSNGAGPSRSRGPDETAAILSKLELFFGTPTFTSALGEFGQQHCGAFRALLAEGAAEGEHPLQWHSVYTAYTAMVESHLESFLAEHGVQQHELLALAAASKGQGYSCFDYLIASTEFQAFLELMYDFLCMSDLGMGGGDGDGWSGGALEPLEPDALKPADGALEPLGEVPWDGTMPRASEP